MVLFESYKLATYNRNIGVSLLVDCSCYEEYRDEASFVRLVYARRSYMGCLAHAASVAGGAERKRIHHRSVPIMIGSKLDVLVRGWEAVERNRAFWCSYVVAGVQKIVTAFSTFDALSLHVKRSAGRLSIDWFLYVDNQGLNLRYEDRVVVCTYRKQTTSSLHSDQWIELLNHGNPFVGRHVSGFEYLAIFEAVLACPYNMNNLENRQLINGETIMARAIEQALDNGDKVEDAFVRGTLYSVLGKKNMYETRETLRHHDCDNVLNEGHSSKVVHYLGTVTRATNDAVRNSTALGFSNDSRGYFCMINTKDLKSAGEQNFLADMVIMTEKTDTLELYRYLCTRHSANGGSHLLINGLVTDVRCDWSRDELVRLKRAAPWVTTKVYPPYVLCSTRESIPVKFCDRHRVFFSPAETTEHAIVYPEGDMLSVTAKELDAAGLCRTAPAKSTVAINNIKGSIANEVCSLHGALLRSSIGSTCHSRTTPEEIERIRQVSMSPDADAESGAAARQVLEAARREFRVEGRRRGKLQLTSVARATAALAEMYDMRETLLLEHRCGAGGGRANGARCFEYARAPERAAWARRYEQMVLGAKHFRPPPVWNLRLWAAFGNAHGACVEDGVVLDRATVLATPPIVYNVCLTVNFTFATISQAKQASFVRTGASFADAGAGDDAAETMIGYLVTAHPVNPQHSKHCRVTVGRIGAHDYHLLHFLPKRDRTYSSLEVSTLLTGKVLTVVIRGERETRVGVGTKVANSFGQKNVCSLVSDLSDVWGITPSGRRVHAQIMYSDVSIVGRCAAGQVYSALNCADDQVAIGPNKELLACVNLVIHSLHPYTNNKFIEVKVDTLTNVNGFDSQSLSTASHALRNETVSAKIIQLAGFHGFRLSFGRDSGPGGSPGGADPGGAVLSPGGAGAAGFGVAGGRYVQRRPQQPEQRERLRERQARGGQPARVSRRDDCAPVRDHVVRVKQPGVHKEHCYSEDGEDERQRDGADPRGAKRARRSGRGAEH